MLFTEGLLSHAAAGSMDCGQRGTSALERGLSSRSEHTDELLQLFEGKPYGGGGGVHGLSVGHAGMCRKFCPPIFRSARHLPSGSHGYRRHASWRMGNVFPLSDEPALALPGVRTALSFFGRQGIPARESVSVSERDGGIYSRYSGGKRWKILSSGVQFVRNPR